MLIYSYIHSYKYSCIHLYMYIHIYINIFSHIHMNTYIHMYSYIFIFSYSYSKGCLGLGGGGLGSKDRADPSTPLAPEVRRVVGVYVGDGVGRWRRGLLGGVSRASITCGQHCAAARVGVDVSAVLAPLPSTGSPPHPPPTLFRYLAHPGADI